MKTMNNFAAQQLSKKQMNEVKGGQKAYCSFFDTELADFVDMDGFYVDASAEDAKSMIDSIYQGTGIVAICHDSKYQ